tara:strand:+ start:219 stop:467 length:249 start_codon:yes stop_codon:yes gene_type:complete
MKVEYPVVIESKGYYELDWFASVPGLPGCFATGKGLAQIIDNARSAISLHVRSLKSVPSCSNSFDVDRGKEDIVMVEVDIDI